jgi:hypothetical protein
MKPTGTPIMVLHQQAEHRDLAIDLRMIGVVGAFGGGVARHHDRIWREGHGAVR